MYQEHLASSCVSGTSCKLLDGDVTTYQERLASNLKKMLLRIRNVLQVTTYQERLDGDVTAYQERLASYLTEMLLRIRNVLQVT